jgi:hypothetical protein
MQLRPQLPQLEDKHNPLPAAGFDPQIISRSEMFTTGRDGRFAERLLKGEGRRGKGEGVSQRAGLALRVGIF